MTQVASAVRPAAPSKPDRIAAMKDAKLISDALKRAERGSSREAFVLRLRKSFRTWGSLTPAMRESLAAVGAPPLPSSRINLFLK